MHLHETCACIPKCTYYNTTLFHKYYKCRSENKFPRCGNSWLKNLHWLYHGKFIASRLSSVSTAELRSWWPQIWRRSRDGNRCDTTADKTAQDLQLTGNRKARTRISKNASTVGGTMWKSKGTPVQLNWTVLTKHCLEIHNPKHVRSKLPSIFWTTLEQISRRKPATATRLFGSNIRAIQKA
jgi:hypothetical protein